MIKRFVEIGSADFNTCLPLAQAGWHGLCVEPVPYLYERVKKQYEGHKVHVQNNAVSDINGPLEMAVSRDHGWLTGCSHVVSKNHIGYRLSEHPDRESDFPEVITVQAVTLDHLLSKTPDDQQIDFLKVDTEGHELNIFMDYSFRIKPRFIKIEHKHVDDILLAKKLEENGYLVWVENDDIYGLI
tara:strand:- start:2295 stop:2849 length:555 start_codon:yes stop_codon:yes gene_type:complete